MNRQSMPFSSNKMKEAVALLKKQGEAQETQRWMMQGLGRPIMSCMHNGLRVVEIGGRIKFSKNWKTFIDFLSDYMKETLSGEWGNAEIQKPLKDRHPLIVWYQKLCLMQEANQSKPGEIYSIQMNGAVNDNTILCTLQSNSNQKCIRLVA